MRLENGNTVVPQIIIKH